MVMFNICTNRGIANIQDIYNKISLKNKSTNIIINYEALVKYILHKKHIWNIKYKPIEK